MVADLGYAATSLGRIADRAGITKAGVLYHFPSKQALVEAAHARVLSELVEAVASAVDAAGPAAAPADSKARWSSVADLLSAARAARGITGETDLRSAALVIGGGIDAIVSESLSDPEYDASAAAEVLVGVVEGGLL
ncbi:helix-turn-helix domain-containing protein [Kribbella sp. NPDC000426]|uniref:TetR/AcrR family transcriptional regulator n=1 Tax=Kribbella sp. NPDC000426 TaxID=3154255 RepID=UPI00331BF9E0